MSVTVKYSRIHLDVITDKTWIIRTDFLTDGTEAVTMVGTIDQLCEHTGVLRDLTGALLGRVRYDGQSWDAAKFVAEQDCYLLCGHRDNIEAAILAVLKRDVTS